MSGIEYVMHVGICVADLERARTFYRDGLGFEEDGTLEIAGEPTASLLGLPSEVELRAVYLERDGCRIELLDYPSPGTIGEAAPRPMNQLGLTHFAIRVTNLDDTIARLGELGGKLVEGTMVANEEYGSRVVYMIDPDGTRLELAEMANDPTR